MVEIIAFFIFHRARRYAQSKGLHYRSSSAIFDAGAWLLLIVLLNSVFLIIIASFIAQSKLWNISASSYSSTYRLVLLIVISGMLVLWIIYQNQKNKLYKIFDIFDNEDNLAQKRRLETNKWIYIVTVIGAIITLVFSSISRWKVAGSIF
jgi:hypothetical protein